MIPHLESEAPNTIKFLKYLVSTLLSREPLKSGKTIIIPIEEYSPNFPEFTDNILEGDQEPKIEDVLEERGVLSPTKIVLLHKYLNQKFLPHTVARIPMLKELDPFSCDLPFIIMDPRGLYKMAEELNIEIPNKNNLTDKVEETPATFSEAPPQINWRGQIIPIPPNSKQLCVCRVSFSKSVGESVHWDEVAEEIDGQPKENLKTNWHTVYNAVRLINQKIEQKVGHKLFKSTKYSFTRIS